MCRSYVFSLTILSAAAILLVTRAVVWLGWWLVADAVLIANVPTMFVGLALDAVLLVAAVRIAWRAASQGTHAAPSLVLKLACLVICVVSLSNGLNQLALSQVRLPTLFAAPDILPVTKGVAFLEGEIDFHSYNGLKNALAAFPDLDTLNLDSPGGRIPAARGLALVVAAAGLKTHVTGICASACTLVLVAGSKRSMDADAKIGFHGYRLLSNTPFLDVQKEQARDMDYFKRRGVSAEFLDHVFATPFEDMWLPTKAELLTSGVLTR